MSDAVGTVGGEEGARCCGVTLTIGAAACVGKGWERASLAEGWGERFWELLESWKYKTGEREGKRESLECLNAANERTDRGRKNRRRARGPMRGKSDYLMAG